MRNIRKVELSDRLGNAAEAKAALLRAYREAQEAAEPNREARQQERLALAEARERRRALREQERHEAQARHEAHLHQQETALAAAALAARDARETAEDSRVARVLADEATRKAERDRRYASRKARQGQRS
ncbi:hypothetical protein GIY56_14280 [Paracoccus sp. YIM 132242]|uniref:Uncharacterized protein n=1 Tax=Paracoccus lichenicola TaxID=2665644 RepID=A0A6L6HT42_9RHOB|nr:hypothetical protein [Paracoccus lichenicola]